MTTVPGGTATYTFSIAPTMSTTFPSPVTLSVSGLPPGATATLTPSTLPAGSSLSTVILVIDVPNQILARIPAAPSYPLRGGLILAVMGGMLVLPFATSRRRFDRRARQLVGLASLLLVTTGAALGVTACGGGGYFAQPVQTYQITITATSGKLSHTIVVSLTVE